eukprot:GHVL01004752.1.p1 GENE.GHVL01004752.1~~GHVL01004752.1.p1  ORF type:complete len:970 (-),score=170.39 GHVL01004752.1:228-2759(-)
MNSPDLIRNICIAGHFHHGKTCFLDMIIQESHKKNWLLNKEYRYLDSRVDEQERGLSIKASPISLVLQDTLDKSYLIHMMDTPGHVNFCDEVTAALRISDSCVILVDSVEGVMTNTERLIRYSIQEKCKIIIVINKIDKLILELRIPPIDAYHKLRHTIEEINQIIASQCELMSIPTFKVSPLLGNVAFSSGLFKFIFTIQSFAKIYSETANFNSNHFARCLWGDVYFDSKSRKFSKNSTPQGGGESRRTFVEFILEPLYKIFAYTVGEERQELQPIIAELGIFLRKDEYRMDTKSLLKKICGNVFGNCSAFVDMLVQHCPSPKENAHIKVSHTYTGNQEGSIALGMKNLDVGGELIAHTTKLYHQPDCASFDAFGRVMSGTLTKGAKVKVLGESYSLEDDEDMAVRDITHLWIYMGRYRVEVSHVPPGNWCLIGGIDVAVVKTATITSVTVSDEVEIFRPLKFNTTPVIKIACEPLQPSELPKMLEGLRKIDKSYPLVHTKVEESGEHVILGTGEIYLDCILHDLRRLYGDLEIKVADPVVQFCETCLESSAIKSFAETPNKKNKIYMVAEPLEKGIIDTLERGVTSIDSIVSRFDWESNQAIWSFGPDQTGPNILVNDSSAQQVEMGQLLHIKDSLIQGFKWATREGPLIEENIRNVKFKILDAVVAGDTISRGGGQVIPTGRRVAYSSFLLATPRLMEPVYFLEITCPADCVSAVYTVLARRRGHVSRDLPKPGSPLYCVHAYIPAIESFGFETDLRTHTSGQSFCLSTFDHWAMVPGDPLDRNIVLRPLEPAPPPHLAREFLLKTRRRKGLSEDVSVHRFFDDPMLSELARQEADLQLL